MIAAALLVLAQAAPADIFAPCPAETVEVDQELSGIYVDEFEGQAFYDGAQTWSDVRRAGRPTAWIEIDLVGLGAPFGIERHEPGLAYRVRLIGTRRSREPYRFPCGYGHESTSRMEVRATRLLAIEPLGSAPQLR